MSSKEKIKTSRFLAVHCLVKWEKERQAVQPSIESIIYGSSLAGSERQLSVHLVLGVLRQLQYLDAVIGRFARHPLHKMKPLLRMSLRVGVYQLLFLDRIPESAAVNETVKVLKASKQPRWIINFANGVLRNIVRNKNDLPGPESAGKNGSAVLNHPEWLVMRWKNRYGSSVTEEICFRNNREPFLVLRVNTLVSTSDQLVEMFSAAGIKVRKGNYVPDSLVIESPSGAVSDLPGFDKGYFHVQDEAAQLVTMLLGPFTKGLSYLDGCAGVGGKTCQLAQMLPVGSTLRAIEPSRYRFQLLQQNLRRLGMEERIQTRHGQLDDRNGKETMKYHGILVDAPCSGTGVAGRHPDIRWNRKPQDLMVYHYQQLELLRQAAKMVLPGGILVYATCSMEQEENEQVIESFLAENSDYSLGNAGDYLPEAAGRLATAEGYFASTPADGVDGFFGARLERKDK